jgi:prolipoprotein diacylglyceryltransferase
MKDRNNSVTIFNARIIGIFFLLAFLAYGIGRQLFESADKPEKYLGALLILANSAMVLFIGILLRKTLTRYNLTQPFNGRQMVAELLITHQY